MSGIYIHIPFCTSRCIYCGFYSTTGLDLLQNDYIDAVTKEISMRCDVSEDIRTIYIGGGTPSLLSETNLLLLGNSLSRFKNVKEFTMECNPNDISPTLCRVMQKMGVNRVSMGVQTFSDARLRFLHRRHSSAEIVPAIECLREHGIKNISIDLMFGFPAETIEEWRDDINKAISLNVEHISAYSLMYEEGTPLYKMLNEGKIAENDEETSVTMYDTLIDMLTSAGYDHYEISNFCKPGMHSRHNSSYWNGTPYIGIGAAAHSYNIRQRMWNVSDVKEYIASINQGILPMEREDIDATTHYNDIVTTALRTKAGIDISTLDEPYNKYIIRYARKGIESGLLTLEDNHIRLTRKGLYVSDEVMSDLIHI